MPSRLPALLKWVAAPTGLLPAIASCAAKRQLCFTFPEEITRATGPLPAGVIGPAEERDKCPVCGEAAS